MIDHFIKRNGKSGVISSHYIGSAISDKNYINTSLIKDPRHGKVIGSQHCYFFLFRFHFLKDMGGNATDNIMQCHNY